MYIISNDKEQQIAWQTLNNTVEKANSLFDRSETSCIETSKFVESLEKDTALLYQTLTQLLENNHNLRATFICFYDSTRRQNTYLIRNKNDIEKVSFNDYITEMKKKSLQEHFKQNQMKPFWEDLTISITDNQAHINFFVPFSDRTTQPKGFIGFNMNLTWIDTLLHTSLTYYENDAHAFMFMLTSDGVAVSVAGDVIEKNKNLIEESDKDEAFLSMIYNMRNGETESLKLKNTYTKTANMFFYKSLKNKKIAIALSYYENQFVNAWDHLFILLIGAVLFFFGIVTLWLRWYWKKRTETVDKIGICLDELNEKNSMTATLPSSPQHQDLEELCTKIETLQRGLDQKNKNLVSNTKATERKEYERKLAQSIRKYFYSSVFQFYDASLSHKIQQHIKISYLPDIGGDFHDYFNISPQQICFVTGTVSRTKKDLSNIQTSLNILMTMNLIRSHFKAYSSLATYMTNLNNDLYSQNNGSFTVNIFIGVLNCETGMLEFVNAGTPTHYMISHRSIFSFPGQYGLSLASKLNQQYPVGIKELSNGDMILIHTAGVLSRQNPISERYGEQRLKNIISATSKMNPPVSLLLENIFKNITEFTENQSVQADDYTLLAIKYEGKKDKD